MNGFLETLGIKFTARSENEVTGFMPITERVLQPFSYLHGGATIALLESLASAGAEENADFDIERPFGIDVHVRHRKSGTNGLLHGRATLERSSESERGRTQYWSVVATDDEGDVVSDGTIVTKIVSLVQLERLKEEREQREAPAC